MSKTSGDFGSTESDAMDTLSDVLEVEAREAGPTPEEIRRDRIEYRWYCDMRDDGRDVEKMRQHFPHFIRYEQRYDAEVIERRYRAKVGLR